MASDEQAIRALISDWLQSSARGEVDHVLELMTDDVVFMVVGRPPFGKQQFAEGARQRASQPMQVQGEVLEIAVHGDLAFSRVKLQVKAQGPEGKLVERAGYAMSLLRRQADGRWLLARDANLLGPAQP